MNKKRLSPMEYTVLGIAWKRGPSTTYALMKELSNSTSTYYKSRAGTAYPLVNRLLKEGLLASAEADSASKENLIIVSETGTKALREWLSAPTEFKDVAHTVDFVRLKVFYLALVKKEERASYIDGALEMLIRHRSACEEMKAKYLAMGDNFSVIATTGVLFETDARIAWLNSIRESVVNLP